MHMETEKLILRLMAQPLTFSFSMRKNFIIKMTAINNDDVVMNPELHLTKLLINKKESFMWMEAIGNGQREANWFSLPPHQSASISWSTMGGQLFQEPGEYILQLRLGNITSDPIKITVIKD